MPSEHDSSKFSQPWSIAFCLMTCFLTCIAGCNSGEFKTAHVSGCVTMDGVPLVGAEVIFAPMGNSENSSPGLASIGITDSQGRYSLETVDGNQNGAVIGKHRVSIDFQNISDAELQIAIEKRVLEANNKGIDISPGELGQVEAKEIKRLSKNRIHIPASYNQNSELVYSVSESGDLSADFSLTQNKN